MKTLYLVTHGEKETGADPDMTVAGKTCVRSLRIHLVIDPPLVCIGEALRHFAVAEELGYSDTGVRLQISSVFGACGSLELIDGEKMLVLASGIKVAFETCTSGEDAGPSLRAKLKKLPNETVICAGREVLLALGIPLSEAKSGSVYAIKVDGDEIKIEFIATGTN